MLEWDVMYVLCSELSFSYERWNAGRAITRHLPGPNQRATPLLAAHEGMSMIIH